LVRGDPEAVAPVDQEALGKIFDRNPGAGVNLPDELGLE